MQYVIAWGNSHVLRTGRPTEPLTLSAGEQSKLELMVRRPKTDRRTTLRAHIVLECAAGKSNTAVAKKLKVTMQTVGKWRERFLQRRLDALGDAPRSGQPRKITDEKVEAVITRTLETRPEEHDPLEHAHHGRGQWTQPERHRTHLAGLWAEASSLGEL